jgi:predicted membrane channel-forming protein YqfA (hemolysin III family)
MLEKEHNNCVKYKLNTYAVANIIFSVMWTMCQQDRKQQLSNAGFEVLILVVMKSSIFWDITPYSPLKINQHFRVTSCFYLQSQRISQVRYEHEAGSK